MSFESTLYAYLSGYTGLTALISTKIYPDNVPQDTAPPYIFYQEVYRQKMYTHNGYNGTSEWSIQISSFATTRASVRAIADQVSSAMDGWSAVNSKVGYVEQENERSLWIEDLGLYTIDQDYLIFYKD